MSVDLHQDGATSIGSRERDGCGCRETGPFGQPRGRPMPSSGLFLMTMTTLRCSANVSPRWSAAGSGSRARRRRAASCARSSGARRCAATSACSTTRTTRSSMTTWCTCYTCCTSGNHIFQQLKGTILQMNAVP